MGPRPRSLTSRDLLDKNLPADSSESASVKEKSVGHGVCDGGSQMTNAASERQEDRERNEADHLATLTCGHDCTGRAAQARA